MDNNTVYLALGACAGISLLIIGLAIPLVAGKIGRNQWYGFRTPKTLSGDAIWYPANHAAGLNLIIAGVVVLLTAVILFLVKDRLTASSITLIIVIVTVVALITAIVKSLMFVSNLTAK